MANNWMEQLTEVFDALEFKEYDSRSKYQELRKKITGGKLRGGEMLEISVFFHVTTNKNKREILRSRRLKGERSKSQRLGPCGPIVGKSGVFFCCSLTKNSTGEITLPEDSPYGTERVKIPVGSFFAGGSRLYFDSFRWSGGSTYVYLVLDRGDDAEITRFCEENLYRINLNDDVIFQRTGEGTYKVYHKIVNKNIVWVEIFVLGDTMLTDNESWDVVKNSGRM